MKNPNMKYVSILLLGAEGLHVAEAAEERAKLTAQSTSGCMYLPHGAIDGQHEKPIYGWCSKPYGGGTKENPLDLWWMLEIPKMIRVTGVKIVANPRKPVQKRLTIQCESKPQRLSLL